MVKYLILDAVQTVLDLMIYLELDSGKTLAELPKKEKNTLSARYLATLDLKEKIKKLNEFFFFEKMHKYDKLLQARK